MADAFTVSKLMSTMQASAEACGGSVKLQRKGDNGVMLDASAEDMKLLDSKSKMRLHAQAIYDLGADEKRQWSVARKAEGNDLYLAHDFVEAVEAYLQALMGLDLENNDPVVKAENETIQVAILCNMAACYMGMKDWDKTVQFCDEALKVDPCCYKALCRRGQAYTKLEKYEEARKDLNLSLQYVPDGDEAPKLQSQTGKHLAKLDQARRVSQQKKAKAQKIGRRMMSGANGGLYEDRDDSRHQRLVRTGLVSESTPNDLQPSGIFAALSRFWSSALVKLTSIWNAFAPTSLQLQAMKGHQKSS
jgi:tetratricopeptide (TPR) repeat protein